MTEDSFTRATNMIIKLQDRNTQLRYVLLKILALADTTEHSFSNKVWKEYISYAKEIIKKTDN
jgi:hypothetical protein